MMTAYLCKTRHASFESKATRTFCSVKCRAADPEFRAVLAANLSKPKERNGRYRLESFSPASRATKRFT